MNTRTIHTGLYTDRAQQLLKQVFVAIQNSASTRRVSRNVNYAEINVNPDGEIVIEAKTNYYHNLIWFKNDGNDQKSKEWLAVNLKRIVRNCFRSDGAWSRCNDDETHFINALKWYENSDPEKQHDYTVAEAYLVYDVLMGRRNISNKYPKELIERIIGKQKDPLKTEMERIRREKLKDAAMKLENEKNRIYNEQQEKLRKAREQFQAEADAERDKVQAAYDAEIAEIERKANSVNRVGSLFAGIAA